MAVRGKKQKATSRPEAQTRRRVRARQRGQTRDRIVHAAFKLFSTMGFERASTSDVAAVAKLAHGTLFNYFPSRDALILAVIEDFAVRIAGRLRGLMLAGSPTLEEVLAAHVEAIVEQEGFYANLITQRSALPLVSHSRLIVLQSAVAYAFRDAAQREIEAGTVKPLSLGLMFNTWLGLLHHYVGNPDLFSERDSVLLERGAGLIRHYLELVRK